MRQASARTTSGMMYGSRMMPASTDPQRGRLCSSRADSSPRLNLKTSDQNVKVVVVSTARTKKSSDHRFT
jgi:hypothetical protein